MQAGRVAIGAAPLQLSTGQEQSTKTEAMVWVPVLQAVMAMLGSRERPTDKGVLRSDRLI